MNVSEQTVLVTLDEDADLSDKVTNDSAIINAHAGAISVENASNSDLNSILIR